MNGLLLAAAEKGRKSFFRRLHSRNITYVSHTSRTWATLHDLFTYLDILRGIILSGLKSHVWQLKSFLGLKLHLHCTPTRELVLSREQHDDTYAAFGLLERNGKASLTSQKRQVSILWFHRTQGSENGCPPSNLHVLKLAGSFQQLYHKIEGCSRFISHMDCEADPQSQCECWETCNMIGWDIPRNWTQPNVCLVAIIIMHGNLVGEVRSREPFVPSIFRKEWENCCKNWHLRACTICTKLCWFSYGSCDRGPMLLCAHIFIH